MILPLFFVTFFSVPATALKLSDFYFIAWDILWQSFDGIGSSSEKLWYLGWHLSQANIDVSKKGLSSCQDFLLKHLYYVALIGSKVSSQ